jgi:hypothetical protein
VIRLERACGQRKREIVMLRVSVQNFFYACKGARILFASQREREKEREKEGGRERKGEKEGGREM